MAASVRSTLCSASFLLIFVLPFFFSAGVAQSTAKEKYTHLVAVGDAIDAKWGCVVCSFLVGLVSQLRQLHHISSNEALRMLCGFFPDTEALLCRIISLVLFDQALHLIDGNETPDTVCQLLGYCKNTKCHLFPPRNDNVSLESLRAKYRVKDVKLASVCSFVPRLCQAEEGPVLPHVDKDGDMFSTEPTRRGSDWRGRDCDDGDSTVFPGRNSSDSVRDENCNGIYGVDRDTGRPYEEMWCRDSSPMGVIVLGDSATAHFGIPADFVAVGELSTAGFRNFVSILENELDWPMLSSTTGFANATHYAPNMDGPMKSFYSQLLERNRCNHRDYQNLGVNGATTAVLSQLMDGVARNRTQSVKPAFLFLSMIGNDVCLPPSKSTTPAKYYNHLTAALAKAEDLLPRGSHVIILPLSDGRILYNTMHNRTHPVGSLNKDVTYADFYNFLNCVEVSPCWGWLNTNETVRNATWEKAQSLNAQIPRIVNESATKFKNIRVHALGDIITGALSTYHGPIWELVAPIDGFHPSQRGSALLGEYMFNKTVELGIVPPVNKFNDLIVRQFGDQGGY